MLFVGDDWAEDHHDLVVIDNNQKVVARGACQMVCVSGEVQP